jgi:polyisoprenoid-binding protein YceI
VVVRLSRRRSGRGRHDRSQRATRRRPRAGGSPGVVPTTGGFDGEIDGTWTVDDTLGDFTFDSASGSFAGFRVDEELVGPGSVVAVGRTGDVSGSIDIVEGDLVAATVEVDLTGLTSDRPGREGPIQRALDTDQFPIADFSLTEPVTLPAQAARGELFVVDATGDLTVHGVTRTVVMSIEAIVRDDGIAVVTGSTDAVWEDYGVTPPSAPVVVSIDDEGVIEFQLLLTS